MDGAKLERLRSLGVRRKDRVPLKSLARVALIAAGVQFGWALQLSLLTPYVQELGIPHAWASWIWLCGPISGMIVQPIVGHYSDNCTSKYSRRRPFIVAGAVMVCFSVIVIGFSADLGYLLGDRPYRRLKPRAIAIFILGFWFLTVIDAIGTLTSHLLSRLLDLANNTLQGPCRALLADFTGREQKRTRRANAYFSTWMAVGNILGFYTGSYDQLYRLFPFCSSKACNEPCANLKAAFLMDIIMVVLCTTLSVTAVKEKQWNPEDAAAKAAIKSTTPTTPLLHESSAPSIKSPVDGVVNGTADGKASGYGGANVIRKLILQYPLRGRLSTSLTLSLDATQSDITPIQESHMPNATVTISPNVVEIPKTEDEDEEEDESEEEEEEQTFLLLDLLKALQNLPRQMWLVLLVTALTWTAWFPFLLFDTDWMGREVYRGKPTSISARVRELYYTGVHEGAFGLMLNSLVLGCTSLVIEPLCRRFGSRNLWGLANLVLAACMASTYLVTAAANAKPVTYGSPSPWTRICALLVFAVLGFPLAVTNSVPYSLTATFTSQSEGGQGLSMGILNLAIVLPQVIVSIGAGPWDELFGGGNLPAFAAAATFALFGAVAAIFVLPKPPPDFRQVNIRRTTSSPIP
eukprot:SM000227S07435  [mRNA]  locus=s227:60106:63891:+ [translate_table: standard]